MAALESRSTAKLLSLRSFYLPVPDAKEIISRRVEFLKGKVQAESKAAQSYFSARGFQVEINDLAILADAVGRYSSRTITCPGSLVVLEILTYAEC